MVVTKTLKPKRELATFKPTQSSYVRCLFYGDSGVGKTQLCGSAVDLEEMKPVLLCDADRGLMTVTGYDLECLELTGLDHAFEVKRFIAANPGRYKTVIFDGLQSLYNLVMEERLRLVMQTPGHDPFVPWREDWMHATFRMRSLLTALKKLPINLLCTTVFLTEKDDSTGIRDTLPALPGKMAREVAQIFDIVGYLYVRAKRQELVHMLQLQPFRHVTAKNRSPYSHLMPPVMTEPTMPGIYLAALFGDMSLLGEQKGGKSEVESGVLESESTVQQSKENSTDGTS